MKAITISRPGGPEVLEIAELPDPVPATGEVLIRVRASGLNHADAYMRSGAWGDVATVPGIEAAGIVEADPSGALAPGTAVVAILGGMGRTRNGSYAELVTVPAGNVVPITTSLPWTTVAAIPEVYATAWVALTDNLQVRSGQTVLVRGATSALGQAVVDLAADLGAAVVATTRNPDRTGVLEELGADTVLIDDGALAPRIRDSDLRIDAVADLVGNSVLRDSLACAAPRGRVCQLGFLGGLAPVPDFSPLSDLPTGIQLSFFGSAFVLGTPEYPLSSVPLQEIFAKAEADELRMRPPRAFAFTDIVEAHRLMESGSASGKMVIDVAC